MTLIFVFPARVEIVLPFMSRSSTLSCANLELESVMSDELAVRAPGVWSNSALKYCQPTTIFDDPSELPTNNLPPPLS